MGVRSDSELIPWQQSMDRVEVIDRVTRNIPREEVYRITNQLRRAAASIPSNIAEGRERRSTRDARRLLGMARRSLHELETKTLIPERLGQLPKTFVRRSPTGPTRSAVSSIASPLPRTTRRTLTPLTPRPLFTDHRLPATGHSTP